MNSDDSKNRLETPLPHDQVEIEDAEGTIRRYTDEGLLVACAGDYSGHKPMQIGDPGPPSVISGEPGYRYRSGDVEIPLTRQEMRHLILHALTPSQYFALRERYGLFPEIGTDHYDPETGDALAPKVRVPSEE